VGQVLEQIVSIQKATISVGGARVQYTQAGSGPPLLLIHGLVGSSRNWDRNIEALAQIRTVYAPDSVNMGKSERVRGLDPGIEAQVARIVEWMDAVGIPAADVIGHSHGASISIVLAARHPERVRKLVLFAPANPFCELGLPQVRFYGTFVGGFFARRIIPLMPKVMYRRSLERLYGDPSRIGEGVLEGYTDGLTTPTIAHIVDVMRGWDSDMAIIKESLPKLNGSRTLLFWGDKDRAVSIESGRRLAEMVGSNLIVIEGAGHVPFQEKPDECNQALLRWLNP
jgi:pimeloyl-ACP methyl ester carboxylesterase